MHVLNAQVQNVEIQNEAGVVRVESALFEELAYLSGIERETINLGLSHQKVLYQI